MQSLVHGGRIDYHIVAESADSCRCIGYFYHTANWVVGICQEDARCVSSSRALVAPVESSLRGQFVIVALGCWLVMASERKSCVCAVERVSPNPGSAGAHEELFADNIVPVRRSMRISHCRLICVIPKLVGLPTVSFSRLVWLLRMQAVGHKDVLSSGVIMPGIILIRTGGF